MIQCAAMPLTFRPLEMGDQRIALRNAQAQPTQSRPLDHRAVASGFLILLML